MNGESIRVSESNGLGGPRLMIHPLPLLVALVVVLVASRSLVVVDVVLLRQSKVFQGERHSVYGR